MTPPVTPDFDPSDDSFRENLTKGFHLLRVERRRYVIWSMASLEEDETITVRELAKQIASVEQDVPIQEVTNKDYRKVYNSLGQGHLSDLHEASVVEYDSDRKTVSPGPNTDVLAMMTAIAIPALHLLLVEDLD